MRKLCAFLIGAGLLLNTAISAGAYTYPVGFWDANEKYVSAINSNNSIDIITYGTQIINLMKDMPESVEKKDILISRYDAVGKAYADIGDYDSSCAIYEDLHQYSASRSDIPYDYYKSSMIKKEQYKSHMALYTDGGTVPYYGAENEKENGVIFGMCANSETRNQLDHESLLLTYQELGNDLIPYNTNIVSEASEKGIAVEFALNCPNEGSDIQNIYSMEPYLKQISDMLKNYSDVPVYLRFAAEFDVWTVKTEPEAFKNAFRYVADYFHQRNSNVAIVWSPNHVSSWDINVDDYYPGDQYVDWVGMSLYSNKYYTNVGGDPAINEIAFKTGVNSDPVIAAKALVEKYGDRKPIMISESGCGHSIIENGRVVEDVSGFALTRLKQQLYYLPMVYPQIKAMAYFDWYVEAQREKNDYRLSTNNQMQKIYLNATKGDRFIQDKFSNNAGSAYRQITDDIGLRNIFPVSCYAHKYNTEIQQVTYFIDDEYAGMSTEIPYTTYIDAGTRSGKAKLKAVVAFTDGSTMTEEYNISIHNINVDITVKISDQVIEFDQPPVVYNHRTLVPMRKIFEVLGADVTWDGDTQTAIGKRGNTIVKIAIGSSKIYVNNKEILLDAPAIALNGRTLVPARAVAEGFDAQVRWNGSENTVTIDLQ